MNWHCTHRRFRWTDTAHSTGLGELTLHTPQVYVNWHCTQHRVRWTDTAHSTGLDELTRTQHRVRWTDTAHTTRSLSESSEFDVWDNGVRGRGMEEVHFFLSVFLLSLSFCFLAFFSYPSIALFLLFPILSAFSLSLYPFYQATASVFSETLFITVHRTHLL